jgi:nicotinamide-nucleotide amidase
MKAEIMSIGTELIIGHTVNTNSAYISEKLAERGISVLYHTSVGDNEKRIIESLDIASKRVDFVITTGGLGPTDDDISHDVIAKFLNLNIPINQEQKKILENKFHRLGKTTIPKINYKQARVIDKATVIPNPIGTAIGMYIEKDGVKYASFPGVPCEMEAMLPFAINHAQKDFKEQTIVSKKIKMADITESSMAQKVLDHFKEKYNRNPFTESNPSLAPYAILGDVYLRLTASAETKEKAEKLKEELVKEIQELFPNNIYGYDDDTVSTVLAKILIEKNMTISFAESCTGGLASKMMTDIPGSSEYTNINFVTYANYAKEKFLNVKKETLEKHGAVSQAVATEMAYGLARISGSNINVSITGIAGPDGASPEKPIGTIFTCILIDGEEVFNKNIYWGARPLSREQVRELACKKIFWIIIKALKNN